MQELFGEQDEYQLEVTKVKYIATNIRDLIRKTFDVDLTEAVNQEHAADVYQLRKFTSNSYGENEEPSLVATKNILEHLNKRVVEAKKAETILYKEQAEELTSVIEDLREHIKRVIESTFDSLHFHADVDDSRFVLPHFTKELLTITDLDTKKQQQEDTKRVRIHAQRPCVTAKNFCILSKSINIELEGVEGGRISPGFTLISSKPQLKGLEISLGGKWGSYGLFQKWLNEVVKWQYLDIRLQKDWRRESEEFEKLVTMKKRQVVEAVDRRLLQIWSGRAGRLRYDHMKVIQDLYLSAISGNGPLIMTGNLVDKLRKEMLAEDFRSYAFKLQTSRIGQQIHSLTHKHENWSINSVKNLDTLIENIKELKRIATDDPNVLGDLRVVAEISLMKRMIEVTLKETEDMSGDRADYEKKQEKERQEILTKLEKTKENAEKEKALFDDSRRLQETVEDLRKSLEKEKAKTMELQSINNLSEKEYKACKAAKVELEAERKKLKNRQQEDEAKIAKIYKKIEKGKIDVKEVDDKIRELKNRRDEDLNGLIALRNLHATKRSDNVISETDEIDSSPDNSFIEKEEYGRSRVSSISSLESYIGKGFTDVSSTSQKKKKSTWQKMFGGSSSKKSDNKSDAVPEYEGKPPSKYPRKPPSEYPRTAAPVDSVPQPLPSLVPPEEKMQKSSRSFSDALSFEAPSMGTLVPSFLKSKPSSEKPKTEEEAPEVDVSLPQAPSYDPDVLPDFSPASADKVPEYSPRSRQRTDSIMSVDFVQSPVGPTILLPNLDSIVNNPDNSLDASDRQEEEPLFGGEYYETETVLNSVTSILNVQNNEHSKDSLAVPDPVSSDFGSSTSPRFGWSVTHSIESLMDIPEDTTDGVFKDPAPTSTQYAQNVNTPEFLSPENPQSPEASDESEEEFPPIMISAPSDPPIVPIVNTQSEKEPTSLPSYEAKPVIRFKELSKEEITSAVERICLPVTKFHVAAFLNSISDKTCTTGDAIVAKGSIVDCLYLITSGEVSEGDIRLQKGSWILAEQFFKFGNSPCSVIAVSDCTFKFVTREVYVRIVEESHRLTKPMIIDSLSNESNFKLSPKMCGALATTCRIQRYTPNEILVGTGQVANDFGLILEGGVEIADVDSRSLSVMDTFFISALKGGQVSSCAVSASRSEGVLVALWNKQEFEDAVSTSVDKVLKKKNSNSSFTSHTDEDDLEEAESSVDSFSEIGEKKKKKGMKARAGKMAGWVKRKTPKPKNPFKSSKSSKSETKSHTSRASV
eukprot:GHVP01068771.1.p1 GENE.GHVP01068771.1~~GHVP01068771.1.p1  ORF type:complete len:1454 (-),score=359.52 GHVP01068771.1:54-3839(-)